MSKVHKLLLCSIPLLIFQIPAHAEITPDITLGKESSVVTPNATINGASADLINGGAVRGNNLFHSFTQFNISDGQRVYFANPVGVQNILTRVTGGQASNIFGVLGVNGAANLFLINPSGILFGKNASLDLRGSLIGTTASSLKFADGTEFNALAPTSNQLLTISVPIGLQFGNQPGAIVNAGNLAVEPFHNLSLIGGSVAVTGNIVAPGGEINIAAVPDNSLVEINNQGNLSSITSTATVTNTNNTSSLIELLKNTAPSDTGIKVTGNNQIELENGITVSADVGTAIISALIDASTYQNGKTGGVVRILGDKVGLFNSTVIGVNGDAGGGTVFVGGDAGANKLINATNVFVDDHVDINASAISQGNGGNISVWSNGNTQFFGYATTLGSVSYGQNRYDTKTGNSGTVTIGARDGLIYKGLVNTYSQDDYSANKTGTLILNYPELTIVDTPLVNNNYANFSQDYNRISWETIANNLAINNLNLFSNGNVIINDIASNAVELQIPKPLNTRTTLGINSSDDIYFTNTKNTIITNGISIKWIANKDIITGNIRTNSPLDLSVGGYTGNIFLASINGKINTSAGQLDTSTHYTNFSSHGPGIATGGVKLEAYGDIITSDIITTSINLYSNDIIIISKAGGIDTSSGRLDTSATRISPSGYSNPGSVTLGAYGKIRTGSIYTNGNAGGQIDITSYNDGIDTTSGTITAFAFYGSVGNINIKALSDIYAGDITTDFTFKKFDGPFYGPFDTRKGRTIENPRGGSINIQGGKLFLDGHTLSANASGKKGSGGAISIKTSDGITIANGGVITTEVKPKAEGNGGEINLITNGNLLLENGAKIINSTSGQGDGGRVSINALGGVTVTNNSQITTSVVSGATGNSGEINIKTDGQFVLKNNSIIQTSSAGIGNAAKVTLDSKSNINIDNGSQISTQVLPNSVGNGGDINLITDGKLSLNGSQLSTNTSTDGKAGNLTINTGQLEVFSGGKISTSTSGQGAGGTLEINALGGLVKISDAGSSLNTSTTGAGNAGNLTINTGQLQVIDGAKISASTFGQGKGGDLQVNAQGSILVNGAGSQLSAQSFDNGDAGNIKIDANTIDISGANSKLGELSGLLTSTFGRGNGGDITVKSENFKISDGAVLNAETRGSEKGGSITINTNTFDAVNGGQVISSTFGSGNAGDITLNALSRARIATQSTDVNKSAVFPNSLLVNSDTHSGLYTESEGIGQGGKLIVNTSSLEVINGNLSAGTQGQGKGGTLEINAHQSLVVSGSSNLSTETRGAQNAGNLTINTGQLQVFSGAKISTSTLGQGTGGTLQVNARNGNVLVSGTDSQLSAQSFSNGTAGNLNITTGQLQVKDSGSLTVSARSGTAGNINIAADNTTLSNNAKITAQTGAGNGGNIIINSKDLLLMRRNSEISTTAGTEFLGGDGGNININAPFIIAVPTENSDITANAFSGKGGNVNIRAQSILGITPRLKPSLTTSDITASSALGVQGQVSVQQPEVQPAQGLIELPEEVVDATRRVAQICPREPSAKPLGEFTITGRGSLPPSPIESLPGNTTPTLASLDTSNALSLSSLKPQKPLATNQIIEAQGWVKTSDGGVELVAAAPSVTPSKTSARAVCPTTN